MTQPKRIRCGPFTAIGSDGKTYGVVYTQVYTVFAAWGSPQSMKKAQIEDLKTTTGLDLNIISKGEYVIVATGVSLKSDHPDAP